MTRYSVLLSILLFYLPAVADNLTVDFNVTTNASTPAIFSSVPSAGSLNLQLSPDGTIRAELTAFQPIKGFGFNGPLEVPLQSGGQIILSAFSPFTPSPTSWVTWFGDYNSGFLVGGYEEQPTVYSYSFTIGSAQQFSSVWDIANFYTFPGCGVTCPSETQFWLLTADNSNGYHEYQLGGDAPPKPSPPPEVPEPSTLYLAITGFLALLSATRLQG